MDSGIELENRAQLCRVTCGWKLAHLPLEPVLRYWRDVHSPSIARRAGIWEYRHFQFEPVAGDVLSVLDGIDTDCPAGEQLMWTSDVRYDSDAAVEAFGRSPDAAVRSSMLADIDLIVDQSTTYRVLGTNGVTLVDRTQPVPPQGKPPQPTFGLFLRRRSDEAQFRVFVSQLSAAAAAREDVARLRLSLFETPDMAAERASGYPIKTHPPERQYQAWIDVSVDDAAVLPRLFGPDAAEHVAAVHAYPVRAVYTSNHAGKPTFVGLRGFPAYQALTEIAGYNQADPALLEWMYGDVARGVTLERQAG